MQTFVRSDQGDGIGPLQQMSLKTYDDDSAWSAALASYIRSRGLGFLPTVIWPQIRVSQTDMHFGSARTDAKEDRQDETGQRQIAATVQA